MKKVKTCNTYSKKGASKSPKSTGNFSAKGNKSSLKNHTHSAKSKANA